MSYVTIHSILDLIENKKIEIPDIIIGEIYHIIIKRVDIEINYDCKLCFYNREIFITNILDHIIDDNILTIFSEKYSYEFIIQKSFYDSLEIIEYID